MTIVPHHPNVHILLLVALLAACSPLSRQYAEDMSYEPVTVLVTEHFTLQSPFGDPISGLYRSRVGKAVREASAIFRVTTDANFVVRLVPVEMEIDTSDLGLALVSSANVQRRHISGYARWSEDESLAVIYVPGSSEPIVHIMNADVIRHEVAHIIAARADLRLSDRWRKEGVAELMGSLEPDAPGRPFADRLLPTKLVDAARLAPQVPIDELLSWGEIDGHVDDPVAESRRYLLSMSLVHFLVGRQDEPDLLTALRVVDSLTREKVASLDKDWRTWLAGIDLVADVLRALGSDNVSLREQALQRLCQTYMDKRFGPLHDAAVDRLVVDQLVDTTTHEPASRYLLFMRWKTLEEALVQQLYTSGSPSAQLTGQALRTRREGQHDTALVHRLWDSLSRKQQWRANNAAHFLDLELKPLETSPESP